MSANSWHTSIIRERLFELLLPHCLTHFSVCLRGALRPNLSGDTAFAEVCSPARGDAPSVTLLSVRTAEFLLCSFYDLARSESFL